MSDIVDLAQREIERSQERFWLQRKKTVPLSAQEQETRYCCDCGELIPFKRVIAVPHCVRCVDCQGRVEK